MKYAELEFTLRDTAHTLRAQCENKFTGTLLELFLDGKSVLVSSSARKYAFYTLPLEDEEFLLYVKITPDGAPSLDLFLGGESLSSGGSLADFISEESASATKIGKISLLKNAGVNIVLFTLAGFLVSGISSAFGLSALLKGLLVGTIVTLVFLIWDLFDVFSVVKNLKKSGEHPTLIDLSSDEELESEIDETVDPDSIELPEDSVSFFRRSAEEDLSEDETEGEDDTEEESEEDNG